jgi:5,10-methylenetetrahydrofolate reductase
MATKEGEVTVEVEATTPETTQTIQMGGKLIAPTKEQINSYFARKTVAAAKSGSRRALNAIAIAMEKAGQ